jgi:hypothetical protein
LEKITNSKGGKISSIEILSPIINKSKKSNIFGPNAYDFWVFFKRERGY